MVISSCSSSKAVNVDEPLTLEDFQDPSVGTEGSWNCRRICGLLAQCTQVVNT